MTHTKQQYIRQIRANTTYPVYRGLIGSITMLGYLTAAAIGVAALIGGVATMKGSFMGGLAVLVLGGILAALLYLLARFSKEAALILADMGDSAAETNSRTAGA